MKDVRVEKPKFRPEESKALAFQCSGSAKTSKQARKEKKKKDKQHRGQKAQKSSTIITKSNLTNSFAEKPQTQKDISQIICYNCSKKGYYTGGCLEPPKSKN